jgi:hypothetical protein
MVEANSSYSRVRSFYTSAKIAMENLASITFSAEYGFRIIMQCQHHLSAGPHDHQNKQLIQDQEGLRQTACYPSSSARSSASALMRVPKQCSAVGYLDIFLFFFFFAGYLDINFVIPSFLATLQ